MSEKLCNRRDTLRKRIGDGLDALLVTDLVNVRYLTGFTGSNGAALVWAESDGGERDGGERDGGEQDRIATDSRYTEQVAAQCAGIEAVIARDTPAALLDAAAHRGARALRIGFEADALTVAQHGQLTAALPAGIALVPTRGVVEALREIKDDDEVALLTRACWIGDAALGALIERGAIAPGRTERQVARELEWEMFALGASHIGFETIVAAGANSAIPHHRPTDAVLAHNDLVKIDFGAVYGGYHADMTRTFVLGEPAAWQAEIYEVVRVAQQAGCDALAAGVSLAAVDEASRAVIAGAGYGESFVHGLGHGVGLQIHEAPGIGPSATGTLLSGAAVTVEPGIYLPGRGGVRIEDTLVVTDSGSQSLTCSPRELRIL